MSRLEAGCWKVDTGSQKPDARCGCRCACGARLAQEGGVAKTMLSSRRHSSQALAGQSRRAGDGSRAIAFARNFKRVCHPERIKRPTAEHVSAVRDLRPRKRTFLGTRSLALARCRAGGGVNPLGMTGKLSSHARCDGPAGVSQACQLECKDGCIPR
jgi:hypothetical protein